MNQKLLQNALSYLINDDKFITYTLQTNHTQKIKNHHYTLSINMLQKTSV